jgi:hypothetical protein
MARTEGAPAGRTGVCGEGVGTGSSCCSSCACCCCCGCGCSSAAFGASEVGRTSSAATAAGDATGDRSSMSTSPGDTTCPSPSSCSAMVAALRCVLAAAGLPVCASSRSRGLDRAKKASSDWLEAQQKQSTNQAASSLRIDRLAVHLPAHCSFGSQHFSPRPASVPFSLLSASLPQQSSAGNCTEQQPHERGGRQTKTRR